MSQNEKKIHEIKDVISVFIASNALFTTTGKGAQKKRTVIKAAIDAVKKLKTANIFVLISEKAEEVDIANSGFPTFKAILLNVDKFRENKARFMGRECEVSTFPIHYVDNDKDALVLIAGTREFKELANTEVNADITDGPIVRFHLIDDAKSWGKLTDATSQDTRAVILENGVLRKYQDYNDANQVKKKEEDVEVEEDVAEKEEKADSTEKE